MKFKGIVKWTDWVAAVVLVMALGAFAAAETAEETPVATHADNATTTTAQAH